MRFIGWIFSLSLLVLGSMGHAQLAENCISQAEMTEIAQHFTQFSSLTKGDYCLDDSETSFLLSGIMFMRKTQYPANMPVSEDELFSGRFAHNWWDYFIGRIDEFSIESSCSKGAIAYVTFWGKTMYVCPMALTGDFTSMDLASVFMHEARHIDGFPHTTCSRGPRQGLRGACDTRMSDGGSYAVTVETYAQLGHYAEGLHPALAKYARSSAVVYADEAFEVPVRVDRHNHLVLMGNDQQFYRLDLASGADVQPTGRAPALGRIVQRALHLILYPDDKSLAAGFVLTHDEGELPVKAGDFANEYNSLSPAQRQGWIDLHMATQWNAKVLRDKLVMACNPRSNATIDVPTLAETPASIIFPNGYDRAALSAHLVMQSGRIFEFGCEFGRGFLRPSNIVFDQTFKRVHRLDGEVIGLGQDGKLYRIVNGVSQPIKTSVDGRIHELAIGQSFRFFDQIQ